MDPALFNQVPRSAYQEFGLSRAGAADHQLRAVGVGDGCIPALGSNLDFSGHGPTLPKSTDTSRQSDRCTSVGIRLTGANTREGL